MSAFALIPPFAALFACSWYLGWQGVITSVAGIAGTAISTAILAYEGDL